MYASATEAARNSICKRLRMSEGSSSGSAAWAVTAKRKGNVENTATMLIHSNALSPASHAAGTGPLIDSCHHPQSREMALTATHDTMTRGKGFMRCSDCQGTR